MRDGRSRRLLLGQAPRALNFTDEMEHALSPQRHLDALTVPVIVAYGTVDAVLPYLEVVLGRIRGRTLRRFARKRWQPIGIRLP